MSNGISYRGYRFSQQGDEFYASVSDPDEPPILIVSRSIAKLCKRIDELWASLSSGEYPVWVKKWLEGNDPRIDPDTLDMLDSLIGTMNMIDLDYTPGEVATYTTNADGAIDFYNDAAVAIWGQEPVLGQTLWNGAYKLLDLSTEQEMSLEDGPMARTIRDVKPFKGVGVVVVRPDGSRTRAKFYPSPLKGEDGSCIGAINYMIPIKHEVEFDVINPTFNIVHPPPTVECKKADPC